MGISTNSSTEKRECHLSSKPLGEEASILPDNQAVAIVGMAGRFPQAETLNAFWQNIRDGVDCISQLTDERLQGQGVAQSTLNDPKYVKAASTLNDVESFDAGFFGYSPREAKRMDPQHRLFLEWAWESLEDAGYDLTDSQQTIGLYAGTSINTYVLDRILEERLRPQLDFESFLETFVGSDKDFLTSRVSYKLNLKGPSITVQTACSTSLVALHLACQSLHHGDCDVALAGAVSVRVPHQVGYFYRGGGIVSPDGHCRAFDENANGTVFGNGGGVVVLKLLKSALADGDRIHAVIRATGINNDGADKSSYTAPGTSGQTKAILSALAKANLSPETISYIEAHGTGTPVGDPIEIDALTQAFRAHTAKKQFCAIGSIKPNIGHLDVASGMAGLIKAVFALKHQQLPPSINFAQPNPRIDFDESPFYVNTKLTPWQTKGYPRRAGVTALGLGGTNAHVILEEAPAQQGSEKALSEPCEKPQVHLLPLSARSPEALSALIGKYRDWLNAEPEPDRPLHLQDICYSASVRRAHHAYRWATVSHSLEDLKQSLRSGEGGDTIPPMADIKPVFVFPGQGSQWLGMARTLLDTDTVFGAVIMECERAMEPYVAWSLSAQLRADKNTARLGDIDVIQPVLFSISIALAAQWQAWGVQPQAVIGHSMGEVAAAYISGALSLEDALQIICKRSQLIKRVSGQGAMAVVGLSLEQTKHSIVGYEAHLSIAVSNGPKSTVISGDPQALETVLDQLQSQNVFCRQIKVDVASHSPQMDPLCDELFGQLNSIQARPAKIPMYSTVMGEPILGESLSAAYWVKNLREPVLFAHSVEKLLTSGYEVFIEMSPHSILTTALEQSFQHLGYSGLALSSGQRDTSELTILKQSLATLYQAGYKVDWQCQYPDGGELVDLPKYPWQRKRYWLDRPMRKKKHHSQPIAQPARVATESLAVPQEDFYDLVWEAVPLQASDSIDLTGQWLIFADRQGVGEAFAARLKQQGALCTLIFSGESYRKIDAETFEISPTEPTDFKTLLSTGLDGRASIKGIVHFWSLEFEANAEYATSMLSDAQDCLCGSVLHLIQALLKTVFGTPHLWLVTQQAQAVDAATSPIAIAQTPLWGLGRVLALEHPEYWGGLVDLHQAGANEIDGLLQLVGTANEEDQIAFRSGQRYVARLQPAQDEPSPAFSGFCAEGTYLVTGGLGGLGLKMARWLVERGARHLVLTSRRGLPPREAWHDLSDTAMQKPIHAIQQLESTGAQVTVVAADVVNKAKMQQVVDCIQQSSSPLKGVIHAAGISIPEPVATMSLATFQSVLAAKIQGAWILHELTQEIPLDCFILFSSAAAIWGSSDLAPYAAANHFLDALAHYRQRQKKPALSVNWGSWDEINVVATEVQELWSKIGLQPMPATQTLGALEQLLQTQATQKLVAAVDWSRFLPTYEVRRKRPLLANFKTVEETAERGLAHSKIYGELRLLKVDERLLKINGYLQHVVAELLEFDADNLPDLQQGFFQMGMDSLRVIRLRNQLETDFNHMFPSTLAFDYPSIESLAQHLAETLFVDAAAQLTDARQSTTVAAAGNQKSVEPIATIPDAEAASDTFKDFFSVVSDLSDDEVAKMLSG